jgi:DNA invertase Pin-like site-specific DNA recombinase
MQRCAIYTRKSSEEGLELDFNSLHAQREACEAFIKSQASEGWKLIKTAYDDGGLSGGNMERPALRRLLADIGEHLIDVVVVYKVHRLTRSLADFAKIVELFDVRGVSFVAVTQQFNTTTSMGRLTLNVLLSFRPVRAGSNRRENPRQDRSIEKERDVDGRRAPAGIRRRGAPPGKQCERSQNCQAHI